MTDEELAAAEAARQNLVSLTLLVTRSSVPTPSQDELNQIRDGTMTADDIVDPGNPEMPDTYTQEQYIKDAIDNPGTPPPPLAPVMPPQFPPVCKTIPYVGGTGTVGNTLTCTMGTWSGMEAEPHSYAYQWQSDGAAIATATSASYVIAAGDSGHSLACVVTATNNLGSTTAPPSNAVAVNGAARSAPPATRPASQRSSEPAPRAS